VLSLAAIFLYLLAGIAGALTVTGRRASRASVCALGAAAIVLHAAVISAGVSPQHGPDVSWASVLSAASWIIVALLLALMLVRPRLGSLGSVAFPGAALSLALAAIFREPIWLGPIGPAAQVHVLSALLAFGLFSIAGLHALVLLIQDRLLRQHRPLILVQSLPPLTAMEGLLFQLLGGGFVLLTLALVSGLLFVNNLFAQHLAHKTLLSVLAWLVFGVLLVGRWRFGWRGRRAAQLTLAGVLVLMLAYFGSKLVLEVILERSWRQPPPHTAMLQQPPGFANPARHPATG